MDPSVSATRSETASGRSTADPLDANDRRRYERLPLDLRGELLVNDRHARECTVRDFSAQGIRLLHEPGAVLAPSDTRLQLRRGELVSFKFELPTNRQRLLARGEVRRIVCRDGSFDIGLAIARVNPRVYALLAELSERVRWSQPREDSVQEIRSSRNPWQLTAAYLSRVLDDTFLRLADDLQRQAEKEDDLTCAGQFFNALVELKANREEIAKLFLRNVVKQLALAPPRHEEVPLDQTLDLSGSMAFGVEEYSFAIDEPSQLAEVSAPFESASIDESSGALAPDALRDSFSAACLSLASKPIIRRLVKNVVEEVGLVHFIHLQRALQPWR